ncbi:MAG: 5'/3'-nucleotidase SurE [Treponematales bacterium]
MEILLTNDDGVECEGITALAAALNARFADRHRVMILAPDSNRSGVSQQITVFRKPLRLHQAGPEAWCCPGSPADCVLAAVRGGLPGFTPGLVLSGINKGENLGTDILYSGTAGAARQAALLGLPAVALSLAGREVFHWGMAASWAAEHLEELLALGRPDAFLNVNIPNNPQGPSGMAFTWPGVKDYHDIMETEVLEGGDRLCTVTSWGSDAENQSGCDWDAVSRNLVSVSAVFTHPAAAPAGRFKEVSE